MESGEELREDESVVAASVSELESLDPDADDEDSRVESESGDEELRTRRWRRRDSRRAGGDGERSSRCTCRTLRPVPFDDELLPAARVGGVRLVAVLPRARAARRSLFEATLDGSVLGRLRPLEDVAAVARLDPVRLALGARALARDVPLVLDRWPCRRWAMELREPVVTRLR